MTHNNLTYPYYLMDKRGVPSVYSFDVKNIQNSKLRPLHKFAQAAFQRVILADTKLPSTDLSNSSMKSKPLNTLVIVDMG